MPLNTGKFGFLCDLAVPAKNKKGDQYGRPYIIYVWSSLSDLKSDRIDRRAISGDEV